MRFLRKISEKKRKIRETATTFWYFYNVHDFERGGPDSPGAVVMLETGNLPEGVEASDEITRILKPRSEAIILVVCRSADEAALIEARLAPSMHPYVQYLWPTD